MARTENLTRWRSVVLAHPSALLLGGQLLAVLLWPFLDVSRTGSAVLGVISVLLVAISLAAVRRTPATLLVALVLGVPALVLTVLHAAWPANESVLLANSAVQAPFYFYVSYALITYLFHDDHVSRDELFAIGGAFTVVAWAYAHVFAAVEVLWPGSFGMTTTQSAHHWFELLFLSFTNLTSVGLSDIVPVLDHARSVVMVEQVTGVLYVGMVVARLVGLTITRPPAGDRPS